MGLQQIQLGLLQYNEKLYWKINTILMKIVNEKLTLLVIDIWDEN